jgi:hypothetical protein
MNVARLLFLARKVVPPKVLLGPFYIDRTYPDDIAKRITTDSAFLQHLLRRKVSRRQIANFLWYYYYYLEHFSSARRATI